MAAGGMMAAGIAVSSIANANAAKSRARFQASQAHFNMSMSELRQKELAKVAKNRVAKRQQKTSSLIGKQRASLAAQGIDIDSGVAAALQQETREFGAEDVMAIENNAWRQAWGLEMEQTNIGLSSQFETSAAKSRARTSLISGGLRAAGTGYEAYEAAYGG